MLRIAFTGTHSTGKTTLCDALSEEFGISKITNITRDTPKFLRGTKTGQELVLTNYLFKVPRLEGDYIIDRTLMDIIAYSRDAKLDWSDTMVHGLMKFYRDSDFYPTHIFYLPIEFDLVQDGERPGNDNRANVDMHIQELLNYVPTYYTITGSVEERLEKIRHVIRR